MTDLASIKAIFSAPSAKLVLAYYRPSVADTEEISKRIETLRTETRRLANDIELHEWILPLAPKNGTPSTSPSANIFQNLLGVENMHSAHPEVVPALLAVVKGELLDVLKGWDALVDPSTFINKFAQHLKSSERTNVGVFSVSSNAPSASIDVAKMVTMGQDLMRKGQATYAEKFFQKALGVLDAVNLQIDSTDGGNHDMEGSAAMVLAWLAISQIVQPNVGGSHANNAAVDRLEKDYSAWITPQSDVSRSVTLRHLVRFLPSNLEWDGVTCSAKKLLAELGSNGASGAPTPARMTELRSLLVVTYFLQGDLERAITEALKLHVSKVEYGTIAMDRIIEFLGENDPLVRQSGWNDLKNAKI